MKQKTQRPSLKGQKPAGIAPTVLLEQVRATAPWALTMSPPLPITAIFDRTVELEREWKMHGGGEAYFVTLLAAHYTTVGTFCPTDVDVRIRQLAWATLSKERLASAVARVLEVSTWPVPPVSARHVVLDGEILAGHQGEWFSVLAGALGRALTLSDQPMIDRTRDWIEAELTREARLVTFARKHGTPQELLSVVTTVAHNVGDLSRVVDTWGKAHADSELGLRYRRLGHEDGARFDGAFVYAGDLNKRLMAKENNRFLPLRTPKALRRERAFLLPFGPYFYEWGRMIGSTKLLTDAERAEIVFALARVHELGTDQLGCLRALAGIHSVSDIDKLGRFLSSEERMSLARGPVRVALRLAEPAFLKKFHADLVR